jgi:two-component system chemotaxis sensor kinase CheA
LLEDQVRSIRLLPLSTAFALFPRLVRDLAREQGKEAELIIEGGDLTVDKRILEEMKDPLMHLLRNALDHGIELPAERERQGKPRQGTVLLRARRENASLLLEVADDGCGLDPAKIRQEAKKRGLLNAEFGMQSAELKTPNSAFSNPQSAELKTPNSAFSNPQSAELKTPNSAFSNPPSDGSALTAMTTSQLQQLIFKAGFSTSAYVTELSGRGVGLDVVRVNVERMKGGIRLESAPGHGLTVQLRLPLCLATTRILLASVGGRPYGLPVEFVLTSRRVRGEEIFTLEGHLAILLDGQPVIVAHLQDLLELPAGDRAAEPDTLACIVIQAGDERLGLLADELLAEEEVVPKPLGPPLKRVRNVSALAMLGSGEICPVLNPTDLLRTSRMRSAECGVRSESKAEFTPHSAISTRHSKPAVLLAEDSALIRAMEKRILEDGGYEVVTAVDGVEALNALGSRHFAAVVSDIVMPNMDGLALAAHIRAEPRYQDLPVILVTSLASDEDKRRGLDVGANAYIPKPSFDQRILLDTLKRLI